MVTFHNEGKLPENPKVHVLGFVKQLQMTGKGCACIGDKLFVMIKNNLVKSVLKQTTKRD